jgi:hypothetical protein
MQYPYHPNGRGFDEFFGFCCGHWSHYFDSTVEHNGIETRAEGYLPDALTERAIAFMEAHREKPFLCYVPLNTPHSPFQVPDRWFEKFKEAPLPLRATEPEKENLEATKSALAMCENIDWNVGRLRDALERLSLTEETIVVYFSDNGPNTWRWNGGMAGKKGSCREGGVRSPCSITWPGRIPAGRVSTRVAGAIDLLPTLASLAGIPCETARPVDGLSLLPLLTGAPDSPWPERSLFALETRGNGQSFGAASIRTERFRAYEDGRIFEPATDPGEHEDLKERHPRESRELKARLLSMKDALPRSVVDAVLPVGYEAHPLTDLPAQDGTPTGAITWSSIHPNCSWFTHWEAPGDEMHWDISVKTAGSYRAWIMYACQPENAGCVIELAFHDSKIRKTVDEAFVSTLKTGFDRVPREESYDKEFRALELGIFRLPAERGALTLRGIEMKGVGMCEVRGIRLELIP